MTPGANEWPGPVGCVCVAALAMPAMPRAAPPMMPADTTERAKVRAMLGDVDGHFLSSPVSVNFSAFAPVCCGDDLTMPAPALVVCQVIGQRWG